MKFLKGLRCMILSIHYGERNYRNASFTFDELRVVTDVVLEYFAMLEV